MCLICFLFFKYRHWKTDSCHFFLSPLTGPPQFFPPATTLHIRHDHQAGQADTWILPSPSGSCRLLSLGLKPTAKLKLKIFCLLLFFFPAIKLQFGSNSVTPTPQCSSSTGVIQEWPWWWGANLISAVRFTLVPLVCLLSS